jgi:hypothetical protein
MQCKRCPGFVFVNSVWHETKTDSALRKLALNVYAELDQSNLETALASWGNLPLAFQQELVMALMQRRDEPPAWNWEDFEAGKARLLS